MIKRHPVPILIKPWHRLESRKSARSIRDQPDVQQKITLFKNALTKLVDAIKSDNNHCTMLVTVRTGVEVDELCMYTPLIRYRWPY